MSLLTSTKGNFLVGVRYLSLENFKNSEVHKRHSYRFKALFWTLLSVVQLFKNQTSRGPKKELAFPWLYFVMKQFVG